MAGILIGIALAAGVAWFMFKSPSPFLHKGRQTPAAPPVQPAKPAEPAANNAPPSPVPAENPDKPRFEFYKVLTDKETGGNHPASAKPADKAKTAETRPAAAYEPQILQAGSFSSMNEAEKLKAKLAMLGVEAFVQTATLPDKGTWYRVRTGPYKNASDMDHTRSFLKQNGVESTPMHAQ